VYRCTRLHRYKVLPPAKSLPDVRLISASSRASPIRRRVPCPPPTWNWPEILTCPRSVRPIAAWGGWQPHCS